MQPIDDTLVDLSLDQNVTDKLREAADLLHSQGADPFTVRGREAECRAYYSKRAHQARQWLAPLSRAASRYPYVTTGGRTTSSRSRAAPARR
ncbi:MAG: hypothetical protein BMS9Abin10_0127 [Gammaproteobacteria bacterium]|nr:MAG: hypothetical protein BMS9Abin10_0127 [Gammaproteobacteria bacterium]